MADQYLLFQFTRRYTRLKAIVNVVQVNQEDTSTCKCNVKTRNKLQVKKLFQYLIIHLKFTTHADFLF